MTLYNNPNEFSKENEEKNRYLDKPVAELELSVRAANVLDMAGIKTVRELAAKTESDMLTYRGFGRKALNELKDVLQEMGLDFGMKFDTDSHKIIFSEK